MISCGGVLEHVWCQGTRQVTSDAAPVLDIKGSFAVQWMRLLLRHARRKSIPQQDSVCKHNCVCYGLVTPKSSTDYHAAIAGGFDPGGGTFLLRGSPSRISLASVARIAFGLSDSARDPVIAKLWERGLQAAST
jgi:hypothetical protein